MNKRQEIVEINPGALFMSEEFDRAIIGYVDKLEAYAVALYDVNIVIDIYIEKGMTEDDAIDNFWPDVIESYKGEHSPIFATVFNNIKRKEG